MHAETGLLAVVGSVCMMLGFTATTVGYGGAAWYVAHAVVRTVH